jgi:hypothetical protein
LNETPSKSGDPLISFARFDAVTTATRSWWQSA